MLHHPRIAYRVVADPRFDNELGTGNAKIIPASDTFSRRPSFGIYMFFPLWTTPTIRLLPPPLRTEETVAAAQGRDISCYV